jgi:hypothetical protein
VTLRLTNTTRRIALVACSLLATAGLGACGSESVVKSADTEGLYVDAGDVQYQVQISRQLNQYSTEDRSYLAGVTSPALKPDEEWFAVFLWAKNSSHRNATTTDTFDIVDTQGNKYYPVSINSQVNPFAWTVQTLRPLGTEPAPDSAASFGPTQGGELLFKLNTSVYSNRPLTLEIYGPGDSKPAAVSLDL